MVSIIRENVFMDWKKNCVFFVVCFFWLYLHKYGFFFFLGFSCCLELFDCKICKPSSNSFSNRALSPCSWWSQIPEPMFLTQTIISLQFKGLFWEHIFPYFSLLQKIIYFNRIKYVGFPSDFFKKNICRIKKSS